MNEAEIERLAAKVVEKLMEPGNLQALASAIAKDLRLFRMEYGHEMAKLGERKLRKSAHVS